MSKAVTLDPDQTWMRQYFSVLLSQAGREEESALAAEKAKTLGTGPN
jgi:hypothetical protein